MRPLAVLFLTALAFPAAAGPFKVPPVQYEQMVNPALERVGSDLRVRQAGCMTASHCHFAARQLAIEVAGSTDRPETDRITLEATFRRGDDQAAQVLFDNTLTVIGATMIAYDPGLAADRRSELLFTLGEAALSTGEAHENSADVHYAVSFNDVTSQLMITVAKLRAGHG